VTTGGRSEFGNFAVGEWLDRTGHNDTNQIKLDANQNSPSAGGPAAIAKMKIDPTLAHDGASSDGDKTNAPTATM
jgi:hypothetical protein